MSPKEDVIEMEGVVEESLPNATFRVTLSSGQTILGHLSGKMRVNFIKILPGDRVLIEMSVYDLTKGRITRRLPLHKPTDASVDPIVDEPKSTPNHPQNVGDEGKEITSEEKPE